LKDPPAEYAEKVQEGVDVWGGLEDIQSEAESGSYENEFEVSGVVISIHLLPHFPETTTDTLQFGWEIYR
jgi:hypothetical protein